MGLVVGVYGSLTWINGRMCGVTISLTKPGRKADLLSGALLKGTLQENVPISNYPTGPPPPPHFFWTKPNVSENQIHSLGLSQRRAKGEHQINYLYDSLGYNRLERSPPNRLVARQVGENKTMDLGLL